MGNSSPKRWKFISVLILLAGAALGGCASIKHEKQGEGEAPIVIGPAARDNSTPLASAYACYKSRLSGRKPVGIGVGDVKDYTGKFSDQEGNAITQGGALMAMSALGKLSPAIRQHERFDTRVAELELVYMDRRQLGGEGKYKVDGKIVPWEPYYGGTIHGSDYFIVGGISELNYNIQSGGAEFQVNQIGPKGRTYVMNVAADLRIVDTRSLVVVHTVSLQKQIVGYEVGLGVFRFFGSNLVDVHAGAKNQEPLQLGVRTIIELGVLELVAAVTKVPHESCLDPDAQPAQIVTPKDEPWSNPPAAAIAPSNAAAKALPGTGAQLAALKAVPVPKSAPKREPAQYVGGNAEANVPMPAPSLPSVSLSDILRGGESRLEEAFPPTAPEEQPVQPTAVGPAVTGGDQLAQRAERITLE